MSDTDTRGYTANYTSECAHPPNRNSETILGLLTFKATIYLMFLIVVLYGGAAL